MFKFHINIVLFSIFLLSELISIHADVVPIPVVLQNDNLKSQIIKDHQSVNENSAKTPEVNLPRSTPSWDISGNVLKCAVSLDGVCLLNEIENLVSKANKNLLREADAEARMITGRKTNDENSPSNLISSITDYVLDVPEILKESISGLIKSGGNFSLLTVEDDDEEDGQGKDEIEEEEEDDEEDDDNEEEEEEVEEEEEEADEDEKDEETDDDEKEVAENAEGDEENATEVAEPESRVAKRKCTKKKCHIKKNKISLHGNAPSSRSIGDARGKKKKKKKALMKLFVVLLLIKAKIGMLLKILAAKLQVKFLIIAFVNLLINLARFWWDLKKGHDHPQKVIYYEHAQHQHHYDGHEDWQSSGPGGGGYWGRRSYDENGSEENPKTAQELAYSKHVPYASSSDTANENSDSSWNLWG